MAFRRNLNINLGPLGDLMQYDVILTAAEISFATSQNNSKQDRLEPEP